MGPGLRSSNIAFSRPSRIQKRLISELAQLLKVSRPTMSRIIDGLEGRRKTVGPVRESQRPS